MELSLQQPDAGLVVRRVESDCVIVGERTLHHSFVLTPSQLIEDWQLDRVDAMGQDHVERLLQLHPELVLLGSGPRQEFAPPQVQARLLQAGVGLECMDNAACARTYNLLLAEGRQVVAAFVLQ
mgnify:CR=1 FL=1